MKTPLLRQRGIALPVMLMILLMMLVTSIFLLKSVNSTTLMAGNVAYESSLRKAADLGLVDGYAWLNAFAATNKSDLNNPVPAAGYMPTYDGTMKPDDKNFWDGARSVVDPVSNYTIQYVIRRLCLKAGTIASPNQCVISTPPASYAATVSAGTSLVGDSINFKPSPQVHYVITSRISGPRGGNVVNQLVVLVGA
ncbi:MAG: hypothetical protein V4631_14215 [Pseudomonadota bacterium]